MSDDGRTRLEDDDGGAPRTRAELHGEDATRLEGGDQGSTRLERDGASGSGAAPVTSAHLPEALRERYEVLPEQSTRQGAQGRIIHARGRDDGERVVIKLYFPGNGPGVADQRALARVPHEHIVRIIAFGSDAQFEWEVMEYLAGGVLGDLRPADGAPISDALAREVLRELSDALVAWRAAGVVQRDFKPDNIFIRRRDPLDLVLGDFGGVREQEHTVVHASRRVDTPRYAAPEVRSGASSHHSAWWTLGIIMAEMVGGRHPWEDEQGRIAGVSIEHAMDQSAPGLDHLPDDWRLLCRGLLLRDEANRWGAAQVTEWLAGRRPTLVEDQRTAAAGVPALVLSGRTFANPDALGRALASDEAAWDIVLRALGDIDSADHRRLRAWLTDWGRNDAAALLGESELSGGRPATARMVRIMALVAPDVPASYRGAPMDARHLADAARRARQELRSAPDMGRIASGAAPTWSRLTGMRNDGVLHELAALEGGDRLNVVADAWPRLGGEYRKLASSHGVPPAARGDAALATAELRLLGALLDPREAGGAVRSAGSRARRDRRARSRPWFAALADRPRPDGDEGLGLDLLLDLVSGVARDEAAVEERRETQRRLERIHEVAPAIVIGVGIAALALFVHGWMITLHGDPGRWAGGQIALLVLAAIGAGGVGALLLRAVAGERVPMVGAGVLYAMVAAAVFGLLAASASGISS